MVCVLIQLYCTDYPDSSSDLVVGGTVFQNGEQDSVNFHHKCNLLSNLMNCSPENFSACSNFVGKTTLYLGNSFRKW